MQLSSPHLPGPKPSSSITRPTAHPEIPRLSSVFAGESIRSAFSESSPATFSRIPFSSIRNSLNGSSGRNVCLLVVSQTVHPHASVSLQVPLLQSAPVLLMQLSSHLPPNRPSSPATPRARPLSRPNFSSVSCGEASRFARKSLSSIASDATRSRAPRSESPPPLNRSPGSMPTPFQGVLHRSDRTPRGHPPPVPAAQFRLAVD